MNLAIDIGNTLVKAAVVDTGQIVARYSTEQLADLPLEEVAAQHRIERSILCSTRSAASDDAAFVRSVVGHCLLFDATLATPIEVKYAREMLGADRLAAAVGAYATYGGRELMVVDFGTAITIDFISADGIFEGGYISAGLSTRLRALHEFTARLPLCTPSQCSDRIACTTHEAIASGAINGIRYEIEGYISQRKKKKCELSVIFSGGDSIFFDKQIKNAIFADRDILFKGLSTILDYNA
ncbi:MAG: type III pantothenate kinase [Rikenellaceae bacterium]